MVLNYKNKNVPIVLISIMNILSLWYLLGKNLVSILEVIMYLKYWFFFSKNVISYQCQSPAKCGNKLHCFPKPDTKWLPWKMDSSLLIWQDNKNFTKIKHNDSKQKILYSAVTAHNPLFTFPLLCIRWVLTGPCNLSFELIWIIF